MPDEDSSPLSLGPSPPSLIFIEQPYNSGPVQLGSSISPDSILAASPAFLPTGGAAAKQMPPVQPPQPPNAPLEPPMLAGRGPPMLRRQNASRFSWPPDPQQEWTYIALAPAELAARCDTVLARPTTVREVAELFTAPEASESRAYMAYYARHGAEIDRILEGGDDE